VSESSVGSNPTLSAETVKRVIVFDVNETLLDLSALDPHFQRVFGDAAVRVEWFQTMLQSAFLTTITGPYKPFGEHFRAALAITALRRDLRVSPEDERAILAGVRTLPPHPDVRPALERLRMAGYRLAALTNSTIEVEEAQLRNAGLADLFEKALSADTGKRLKPAPEAYTNAARELGAAPTQIRMVAAHTWDVYGAMRAGCAAALVERPGVVWNPLLERPDIVGPDLGAIAESVIELDR
jgi:2-haloacid dehalogenase